VVGLVLAALSWSLFPNPPPARRATMPRLEGAGLRLVASYALIGVAATPHMGWWPDFIARGLGQGTSTGAGYWLLYGVAAMAGPALCGRMADRIGARRSFLLICAGLLVALALPLLSTWMPVLVVSTILAGGTTIGSTALALTRAREVAGESTPGLWGACTVGWAASQTGASFFLAWLYTATGGHLPLFGAGLVAAAGAAWLMRK
jgi:predicted MFS family arabinose efflux permease